MTTVPLVTGMGVGLGALFVVFGLRGAAPGARRATPSVTVSMPTLSLHTATGLVAGIVMFLVTGWTVGAALVGLGAATLPRILGHAGRETADVERIEAVAAWAEMLRDTMAAASGLEEAIVSTGAVAPEPIEAPVRRLAARLRRERLAPALQDFAEELDDSTIDLIVTALTMAETRPARDLGSLLGALARSARMEASMRLRVHASRGRLRTAVRVVVFTTLAFAGVLVVFSRDFLRPYDDALGQAWLLLVGMLFVGAIWKLQRMAHVNELPRLLDARAARETQPC